MFNKSPEQRAESVEFRKRLVYIAVPLVLQEVLANSVNLLDSFMVGSLGINAINGVGFANQVYFLIIIAMFGVNSGSAIFMGQYWGKGEPRNVRKTLGVAVCVDLTIASVFALSAFIAPRALIGVFAEKTATAVIDEGAKYIRIVACGYFMSAVTGAICTALKSCGQTRLPMATTILSLVISASGNALFIFVFKWGVVGCAISTVIARTVELTAVILLSRKFRMPVVGKFADYISARKDFLKPYFSKCLPVMANEFIWALGTILYTVAYKFTGNDSQGAQLIAESVRGVFTSVGFGVGSACGIILANTLGSGAIEKAKRYAVKSLKACVVVALTISVFIAAAAGLIVRVYNVEPDVRRLAVILLYVIAATYAVRVWNYVTIVGILRSGGDTKFCLVLDLIGVWGLGLPAAFISAAALHMPIYIVASVICVEEIFKIVFSTLRVKKGTWARRIV